jgi:hypothetical protein
MVMTTNPLAEVSLQQLKQAVAIREKIGDLNSGNISIPCALAATLACAHFSAAKRFN